MNISQETIQAVAKAVGKDIMSNNDGDDLSIAQAAIAAFLESKEMRDLLGAAAFTLGWLEADGKSKNIEAIGVLYHAILPFQSNDKKGA